MSTLWPRLETVNSSMTPWDQANDHGLGIRQVRHPLPLAFCRRAGFHPVRVTRQVPEILHSAEMTATRCSGLAAACVIAAALLTACSSTSSKPAVCTAAANLKTSVQDLKNVNVRQNGISAVSDQLSKIEQELGTLKTDAKGQYSTQIDDLSTALSSLTSSVNAARAHVNTGTLSAVASGVGSVVSAGNNLVTAVSNTC